MCFMGCHVNKKESIKMHLTERKPFMEKMPFSVALTAIKAHKHNNTVLLIVGKEKKNTSQQGQILFSSKWVSSRVDVCRDKCVRVLSIFLCEDTLWFLDHSCLKAALAAQVVGKDALSFDS